MKMYKWMVGNEKAHTFFQWLGKCGARSSTRLSFVSFCVIESTQENSEGNQCTLIGIHCVFCHENSKETTLQLFYDCTLVQKIWDSILPNYHKGISIAGFQKETPQKIALDVRGAGIFGVKEIARYLEWKCLHLVPGNIF